MEKERLDNLAAQLGNSITENLSLLQNKFANKVVFSTSFGAEDQLISYFIAQMKHAIDIFTLDTGRLFPETYDVWESTRKKYGLNIKSFAPETIVLQQMLDKKGPYSFYDSVENRKECCYIRKVVPLKKALTSYQVWVTGLRTEQSANRQELSPLMWDETHKIIKYQPLLHYSREQVMEQLRIFGVPYNLLHDKGFLSIGCQPCTRAVEVGEDERAGRWWWENSKKECGLHSN
jgi:phosphoadenosine phosphosulfate reductase